MKRIEKVTHPFLKYSTDISNIQFYLTDVNKQTFRNCIT